MNLHNMETERTIRYDKNNNIKRATIMSNSIVIQTNSTVIEDMKQQYKHSLSRKLRKAESSWQRCHLAQLQHINLEK